VPQHGFQHARRAAVMQESGVANRMYVTKRIRSSSCSSTLPLSGNKLVPTPMSWKAASATWCRRSTFAAFQPKRPTRSSLLTGSLTKLARPEMPSWLQSWLSARLRIVAAAPSPGR
jgi:hypothetical protein